MKKLLLMKTVLLLFALVVGSSNVWAAEAAYYTLKAAAKTGTGSNNSYTGNTDVTINNYVWNVAGNSTLAPWRIGGKKCTSATSRTVYSKTKMEEVITKVTFDFGSTFSSQLDLTSVKLTVSTAANGAGNVLDEVTKTSGFGASQTLTFTPSENKVWSKDSYYLFTFTFTTDNTNTNRFFEFDSAVFYYDDSNGGGSISTVVTPQFNHGTGTYTTAQNVELSCDTEGATIHYTMTEDGTTPDDPTESDATYSSAISVTKNGSIIKAKAFKEGSNASSVASATYTIKPNAPTITGGTNVTITGDAGLTFYYTTDGNAPTDASTEYTGAFTPGDCTVKAIAYDTYGNKSDVSTLKYKYMPLAPKNIGSGYYVKVTDVNDLENGDAILIVNESADKALGPQDGNNCPSKDVTITNNVISDKEDAQKLVLVKKTEEVNDADTDVFYFYTGSAYLYAASSGSNHLKTEATPDANARATISISAGNAAIQFTGSNTRNQLKYNSTSDLFSCYSSGQNAVQIYKEVAHSESLTPAKTYTTLTSAYALDFTSVSSDIKAYIATEVSGSAVQMIQVNKVPAGTGLVIKKTGSAASYDVPVFDGTGADDVTANKMAGSATETTAIAENEGYILSNGAFHPATAGTLAAGKAYLAIAVSSARALEMTFDDDVTAIETVKAEKTNNEYYNLAGQRVAQPTKGLYIVNGRKVVVK